MINSDFYAEYLVEKKNTGSDTAKKALIFIGALVLAVPVFMFIFIPINLAAVGFLFYGAYILASNMDTEYEYIVSSGDMDIDKVMGKRKRKRLITAPIGDFTAFGRLADAPPEPAGCTTVLASDGSGENEYFADFVHKSAGNVRIIFTPSEKILEGIKLFLPRQLKVKLKLR